MDHFTFLGNCPPTPTLSQHFALSEKEVLMLAYGRGTCMWAVSQKCLMIQHYFLEGITQGDTK